MNLLLLGLEALAFTLGDYAVIKRRELYGKKGSDFAKALRPTGWKQIVMLILMALSMVSAAAMLVLFYEQNTFAAVKHVAVLGILWPIAVNDYREYRIPNKMVLIGLICRVILLIPELIINGKSGYPVFASELIAAVASVVICLVCMLISRGGMGMGDLKLIIVMSLFLGIDGIVYAIMFTLVVSFVACVILLIAKKKNRKDVVPFAPFILAGSFLSFILSGM